MKRLAVLALLVILVVAYVGCRDDVFVEPPPSLTGDYTGTYTITIQCQTPEVMFITWRFTSSSYILRRDTTVTTPDNVQICCNSAGSYILGNNVELEEVNENLDQITCASEKNPQGIFGLDQSQAGRVLLRQVDGDVTREIILLGPN